MIAKVDGLRGKRHQRPSGRGTSSGICTKIQQLSEGLADELGANRCFKIINNKYLTKNGL